MEGVCAFCNEKATKVCQNCKTTFYCSVEHQRSHWKTHNSTSCRSWKIKENVQYGRYVVATRDINEGELILTQLPLVIGPKTLVGATCLACHQRLNPYEEFYYCSECGWPMCSKECEERLIHRDQECKIFKEKIGMVNGINYQNEKVPEYSIITPLRCALLKNKNNESYQELMSLESHFEQRENTRLFQFYSNFVVPYICQRLNVDIDAKSLLTITGILDTNSFEIQKPNNIRIRGLYTTVSMVSHDCKPNSKHTFSDDNYQLNLYATAPIKRGEIISATYTQLLWNTMARRQHLKSSKLFDCTCQRCSDSTELGLYAGSIYCPECDDSHSKMISVNSLDNDSIWRCETCDNEMLASDIQNVFDMLRGNLMFIDKSQPNNLEEYLSQYKTVVHDTNSCILDVKYALFQQYGSIPGYELHELSESNLQRKINLCEELLHIANIIEGHASKFRGIILLNLQASQLEQIKRKFQQQNIDFKEYQALLKENMNAFKEAEKILEVEPDMKTTLQNAFQKLNDLLVIN